MSYNMTYNSLIEDLQNYLERGTSEDTIVYNQLPRLINMAERRISRELKLQGFQNTVTSTLVIGVPLIQKPDRFLSTISMFIGTGAAYDNRIPLYTRTYEYLRNYWPSESSKAQPEIYADHGAKHWVIAPTPDKAYGLEVTYYEHPPFLGEASQTNWITEMHPQLLLYATLLEASPFLKDDARVQLWQQMYQQVSQGAMLEDAGKIDDRSVTRKSA